MEFLDLPFVDPKYVKAEEESSPNKFGDFYDQVCHKIRSSGKLEGIMTDFQKLGSNFERVKYVWKMEDVRRLTVKEVERKDAMASLKFEKEYDALISDETKASKAHSLISRSIQATPPEDKYDLARRYMKRGWASLLQEQFETALLDAQRSLSYGVTSDLTWNTFEIMGHCYAKQNLNKKSESYFKQAIDRLRTSSVPQEIKAMATIRIASVYKTVKGKKDIKEKRNKTKGTTKDMGYGSNIPTVSYGQHKVLDRATKAVQVIETEDAGRGIFAATNIKPGDYIIVEEPYVCSLNYECFPTNCITCFRRLEAPLPCPTCSLVWFCGEKCEKEGLEMHSWECKILSLLYDQCIGKMALIVFRILRKATWAKLKSLRDVNVDSKNEESSENKEKENGDTWKWKEKTYSTHDYLSTHHLVTNDDKRSFGDLFKRSLAAIYIVECLKTTRFFHDRDSDEDIMYAASLSLLHFQGSSCNAYGITEYVTEMGNQDKSDVKEIGGAIYPTISLTNHSCCPNVLRYSIGTTCVLRATKSISKGDQVLDNYGSQFHLTSLRERREVLQSQYKFECNCEACDNDWPLYPHRQESLTFACPGPNCNSHSSYLGGKKASCTLCGNSEQYGVLLRDIKVNLNEFEKGLSHLNKGSVSKALPILFNFQMFLDKNAIPPGKSLTDSQVMIKQCFLGEGNKYIIPKMKKG